MKQSAYMHVHIDLGREQYVIVSIYDKSFRGKVLATGFTMTANVAFVTKAFST